MDSLNKNISEDDIDILLAKYITGETTAKELEEAERWISATEKNKIQAKDLQFLWEKCKELVYSGTPDVQNAWRNFRRQTIAKPEFPVQAASLWSRWIMYAAAILLITGICSGIYIWYPGKSHGPVHVNHSPVLLQVLSGNHTHTDTLPDGSIAILQPNTSLSYLSFFEGKQRNVSLAGDAFFIVRHDSSKPFRIVVNDIIVTVLGTSFRIASSASRVEIFVKTGIVEVSRKHQTQILHAQENLIVPKSDSPWIREVDSSEKTVLQKEKKLNNTTLPAKALHLNSDKPLHALLVGDDVPILPLDMWIKGGPLNMYERGKVYLVDFWAVWCGPCIAGMGRLSDLQKKYKDQGLLVMSVTSEDAWGNSYDKVRSFINSKGDKFDYNFAWLPESYGINHKYKGIIYNPWLELAYDSSTWALPQAFLIDKNGKIAFIGDGYELNEDFIASVLNNSYDTAAARKNYIEKLILENRLEDFLTLLNNKNISRAITLGHNIVENRLVNTHTLLVISDDLFNKYKDIQTSELLQLGMEAAKKGVKITGAHAPSQLSVLSKGYSLIKEPEQAVKTIKSAIAISEGDFKEALEKDLKVYEQMVK
ncbi:MAG TPA: FecR domain-containing protein [Puia sp.]|nr:FecR domain-containing protein [Puia sp.]